MGETPVHTLYGLVPIERIDVGSQVLSRCETTGERAYRRVVRKFVHEDRQLLRIEYATADGQTDTLFGTAEHPFWVKDVGWTEAGRLQSGQVVMICDPVGRDDADRLPGNRQELALGGEQWLATVVSVTTSEYVLPVYNFEVEGFHTYFVGSFGVWVHNTKSTEPVTTVLEPTPDGTAVPANSKYFKVVADYGNDSLTNINAQEGQNQAVRILGQHGLEVVPLPEGTGNTLGKVGNTTPDILIKGATAEIYTPRGSVSTIMGQLKTKTTVQSSDIVVNLSQNDVVTPQQIWTAIKTYGMPGLRRLYIIDQQGNVTLTVYPDAGTVNRPIYGVLDYTRGVTREIKTGVQPDTGIEFQEVSVAGTDSAVAPLTQADASGLLAAASQYWLNAGAPAALLNSVTLSVGNLPVGIAAETAGSQITLSVNGAGWGWFVDPNPTSEADFTATSQPNVFTANAGGPAAGKLDLLTVLIHEMGHALGLSDVSDNVDNMATFLAPGLRRLPSADDIAQMLAAAAQQLDNTGSITSGIALTIVAAPPTVAQPGPYVVGTVQTTLANGKFATGLTGWTTTGAVTTDGSGNAILANGTSADAQLSQTFNIDSSDRYLEFTVANGLQKGDGSGPQDAFDVALDNVSTGTSLVGTDGLSNSDGVLNIQADGTEKDASIVSKTVNADGTTTYVIDLRNALAGGASRQARPRCRSTWSASATRRARFRYAISSWCKAWWR